MFKISKSDDSSSGAATITQPLDSQHGSYLIQYYDCMPMT